MKLKNKMLFLIGVPILLAVIILTIVSYTYSRSLLVDESKETMLAYAGKYASDIETIISEKKFMSKLLPILFPKIKKEISLF